jgi:long-chain acyl-CoA synthetase
MNVFSLFENAVAAWGDRTAVRCGARRQTYRELDAAAAAFAGHLASLGLAPGDRVAVFMQNGLLYLAVLMGAFRGGYVAVPINAKLHPREVGYIVENAAAKAIVVDSDALEGVAAAAPSLRPGRLYRRGDVFRARQSRSFASARDRKRRPSGGV